MSVNEDRHNLKTVIDGKTFKNMLFTSLMTLKEQKSLIDSLNVFPVPDGDTGTNMYLTYLEAINEVKKLDSHKIDRMTSALAKGALMGARGNSGVILSQLLRGFSQALKDKSDLTTVDLVKALRKASEVAYQGVLKPVEGTILTVSRKAASGAEAALKTGDDFYYILATTIDYARKALNQTPEQLPALKEAEVVDAGGQGYLSILEGMLAGLQGKKKYHQVDLEIVKPKTYKKPEEEIKYTYCTQLLINMNDNNRSKNIDEIRNDLQNYGDSLMVVGADNIVKIHIHTNHPGVILEYGLKRGNINDIEIDNMKLQSEEKRKKEEEKQRQEFNNKSNDELYDKVKVKKDKGIIAVTQGNGLKKILNDLGVDKVIDGGQSMNPSTNQFVEAVKKLDSSKIIILPNNKNVISAAKQAASLSDKDVEVVSTKNIPQAISALLVFNDEVSLDELKEAMEMEIENVKTVEITTAVKNSKVKGLEIKKGNIIGIIDSMIEIVGNDYKQVVIDLFDKCWEEEELITIYYGQDINEEDAENLKAELMERFDIDEIEVYRGEQPLYPYIISME